MKGLVAMFPPLPRLYDPALVPVAPQAVHRWRPHPRPGRPTRGRDGATPLQRAPYLFATCSPKHRSIPASSGSYSMSTAVLPEREHAPRPRRRSASWSVTGTPPPRDRSTSRSFSSRATVGLRPPRAAASSPSCPPEGVGQKHRVVDQDGRLACRLGHLVARAASSSRRGKLTFPLMTTGSPFDSTSRVRVDRARPAASR